MGEAAGYVKIQCPGCRVVLKVPERLRGGTAKCPKCGFRLTIDAIGPSVPPAQVERPLQRPVSPSRTAACGPSPARASTAKSQTGSPAAPKPFRSKARGYCGYCQSPIDEGEGAKVCRSCGASHHAECWEENRGCTRYGCPEAPKDNAVHERAAPDSEGDRPVDAFVSPAPGGRPEAGGPTQPRVQRKPPLAGFFISLGVTDYENYLPYFAGASFLLSLLGPAVKLFALTGLVIAIPVMVVSSSLVLDGDGDDQGAIMGKRYVGFAGGLAAAILSGFGLFS